MRSLNRRAGLRLVSASTRAACRDCREIGGSGCGGHLREQVIGSVEGLPEAGGTIRNSVCGAVRCCWEDHRMPPRNQPAIPDELLDQLLNGSDPRAALTDGGLL